MSKPIGQILVFDADGEVAWRSRDISPGEDISADLTKAWDAVSVLAGSGEVKLQLPPGQYRGQITRCAWPGC